MHQVKDFDEGSQLGETYDHQSSMGMEATGQSVVSLAACLPGTGHKNV